MQSKLVCVLRGLLFSIYNYQIRGVLDLGHWVDNSSKQKKGIMSAAPPPPAVGQKSTPYLVAFFIYTSCIF